MSTLNTAAARAEHSRFVQRVRRRCAPWLPLLPSGAPDTAVITALVERLQHDGQTLPAALRIARQLVLERLAVLDVETAASLSLVTHAMTALAEATLEIALAEVRRACDVRHGTPRNGAGESIDLWIVGMGKLGARELNYSPDIDLIVLYDPEARWRMGLETLHMAANWSAYEGIEVRGRAVKVFSRGELVVDGESRSTSGTAMRLPCRASSRLSGVTYLVLRNGGSLSTSSQYGIPYDNYVLVDAAGIVRYTAVNETYGALGRFNDTHLRAAIGQALMALPIGERTWTGVKQLFR